MAFQPDVLIVPECENPDRLKFGKLTPTPVDYYWYGSNENKGLGIFSYSHYGIKPIDAYDPRFKYIVPFRISGNSQDHTLFAIWAMDNKDNPEARYIGQIWLAINHYKDLLNDSTILLGDFNSNKIWDYKDRVGNHSDVVEMLEKYSIRSLYHEINKLNHGEEKQPTFFMQRKRNKPYHIDYCFASKSLIDGGCDYVIGIYDDWIDKSDHVPIIINIRNT
jgi:exodeoxyribonuclease III